VRSCACTQRLSMSTSRSSRTTASKRPGCLLGRRSRLCRRGRGIGRWPCLAFDDAAKHSNGPHCARPRGEHGHARRAELLWRLGWRESRWTAESGRRPASAPATLANRPDNGDLRACGARLGLEAVLGADARLVDGSNRLCNGHGDEALRAQVMARLAAR